MPMILRSGTAEDAGACAGVWERALRDRDGEAPTDLEHVRRRLGAGQGRLRLALDDDREVLGFAFVLRAGADALLSHLAVAPEAQRRGIAAELVRDAAAHARTLRAPRLLLEVRTGNAAARRLYARSGFRVLQQPRPHPLGGQPLQLLGLDLA